MEVDYSMTIEQDIDEKDDIEFLTTTDVESLVAQLDEINTKLEEIANKITLFENLIKQLGESAQNHPILKHILK